MSGGSVDLSQVFEFTDRVTGTRIGLYRPVDRFDLWSAYVTGARASYQLHGVERALLIPPTSAESLLPYFSVARDRDGAVVAGFQINGPLDTVSQATALEEFAESPESVAVLAAAVRESLAEGIIELKGAWVAPSSPHRGALAQLLARCFIHASRALNVRYAFCSAATHAAKRWIAAGGRPLPGVEPIGYPDERYVTTLLWWDVTTTDDLLASTQRDLVIGETREIFPDE